MQFKKPMAIKSPEFIYHPEPGDEVHCVAVVVDASQVDEDDEEDNTKRQLVAFMDILNEKGKRFTVNICLNVGLCQSPRHMSFDLDCYGKVINQCIDFFLKG